MKHNAVRWELAFGIGLIVLAALLHYIHFMVFGEVSPLLSFLGKKIAFVPLEVLFITLIFHRLLGMHERSMLKKKMNMLSGAFFSEIGSDLIGVLHRAASIDPEQAQKVAVRNTWTKKDFDRATREIPGMKINIKTDTSILNELRELLTAKRQYLILLLGNPNLLEHESFSDMLWAAFHLSDELSRRPDLESLPQSDLDHLGNDARRVYVQLLLEWFSHLAHLKKAYPYLFSLEMRTNPFDPDSSVVVST